MFKRKNFVNYTKFLFDVLLCSISTVTSTIIHIILLHKHKI